MHARHLVVSLAPLFAVSLAHAQAPGEMPVVPAAPEACGAPCGCARAEAPESRESVMANRWSVGFSLGSMSLAPDGQSDNKTAFGIGELALRFRATPRFELELAAGGGRQQLDNNAQGDLQVSTVALAARFRFNPEGQWNWFLMGGLGAASVTSHDATQQQRDDATHPLVTFGVGVERRFHHFALQAEARVIGIGDKKQDAPMAEPVAAPGAMATTVTPVPTTDSNDQKLGGGQFTIGASYYF
jgi:opacity protein-like surface antigen